jgi:hypothetical protein
VAALTVPTLVEVLATGKNFATRSATDCPDGNPIQVAKSVDLENKPSPTMSAARSPLCAHLPVHSEERAILFDFGTKE